MKKMMTPLSRFLLAAAACLGSTLGASAADTNYHGPLCFPSWPNFQNDCGSIAIPDLGSASVSINVPFDPAGNIIARVDARVWVQHTYQGDLSFTLTGPDGNSVLLQARAGGGGFSEDDFGRWYIITPPPTPQFQPVYYSDLSLNGQYDAPNVAPPGYLHAHDPNAIPFILGTYWQPSTPLSSFVGGSKVGTWTLTVTDHAAQDVGAIRYFGLVINSVPIAEPLAVISAPPAFDCICAGATISGTADDPIGQFVRYDLEYSASPNGPWTLINSSTTPVNNGPLGAWPPLVPDGLYFLRLTTINGLNLSQQFTSVVRASSGFDTVAVVSPANNGIVGGTVCLSGTVDDEGCFDSYTVDYRPAGALNWTLLTTSNTPVINSTLASINSSTLADGDYDFRVTGATRCGQLRSQTLRVTVDNSAPIATITSPTNCSTRGGVVAISGTATDAHLSGWLLQYTGGASNGWVTIASGNAPVINGVLANWNTTGLQRCAYTLRLVVSDRAGLDCSGYTNASEFEVSLNIGCTGDITQDGAVNEADLGALLGNWQVLCP